MTALAQPIGGGVRRLDDPLVDAEDGPAFRGDRREHAHRVVPGGLPQAAVELLEERLQLAVPGPVEVARQPVEGGQWLGDGGDHVEVANSAHSGEVSRGAREGSLADPVLNSPQGQGPGELP